MKKPFKGQISNWRRVTCHTNPWPGEKEPNLGYCIRGIPHGHPMFENHIYTSPVVKHEGEMIETLNSRYRLLDAEKPAETKISKSNAP